MQTSPIALRGQRDHLGRMDKPTPRATKRPEKFEKPAHWTNTPAPKPQPTAENEEDPAGLSPTRYGDWVRDGIAVDF